jgi:hypothetical protein
MWTENGESRQNKRFLAHFELVLKAGSGGIGVVLTSQVRDPGSVLFTNARDIGRHRGVCQDNCIRTMPKTTFSRIAMMSFASGGCSKPIRK